MARDDGQQGLPQSSIGLRILLIEDNSDEAELCRGVLKKYQPGIHVDVVATKQEFGNRLRAATYDVILSDYTLGNWTGADALSLLQKEKLEIPFILVTGSLGEEKAVGCIKNGMADFVLKDRLERLPIAISQSLEMKRLREEYQRAENSIRQSEAKFRTLADAIPAAIFIELNGRLSYTNQAAVDITGYSRDELLSMDFLQLIHPNSKDEAIELLAKHAKSSRSEHRMEIMIRPKASEARWLDATMGKFADEGGLATLITALDITERRRVNREIQNDEITGLPNRQHLTTVFDLESSRTRRTGHTFSVLLLFLDGMDRFVQKHGQLAAGEALRHVSRTARHHCRNLDTIGRVASDQFAMILPETDTGGALVLGRRIADRLSGGGRDLPLHCAYAAAGFPTDGETFEQLLKTATRQILSTTEK